jgi:hypothetical protein
MRFVVLFELLAIGTIVRAAPSARETLLADALERNERFWQRIFKGEPYETLGSRSLFNYALTLCEARRYPDRLARLFELAARMQDHSPESPTYGNLKWTWRDPGVTDQNAVEFCTQDGLAIWLKHRPWLPERARRSLQEWLLAASDGCLRHRVAPAYTNIALLNAGNLIVLGETLSRPEVAQEGYRRLDAFCLWTWAFGIQEYCSPTYYGTDLDGLLFIHRFAQRESVRQQAAALLDLFWTDLALNWFAPAGRLAGPHSRTYDYLRGVGYLHRQIACNGWLPDGPESKNGPEADPLLKQDAMQWKPPESLRQLNLTRYPRLVRQSWGLQAAQSRTHLVYPDVTLGCAGACYGLHDMPLTVDLPGDQDQVRCYFIADGREDPYGKVRYETSSARHMKALHLQPFWAGAQQGPDALGLVVYRPEDLTADVVFNVQSHFVLRGGVDGFWLRGQRIEVPHGSPRTGSTSPGRVPVGHGDPLVFRQGTAAVGIRLLWACAQDGSPAPAALVDDGNSFGALRLTVDHRSDCITTPAGAAFWVSVGSGLKSDEQFETWRRRFERAHPLTNEASGLQLHFAVPGQEGPVSVVAEPPFGKGGRIAFQPEPSRALLELNGTEIGRPKLSLVEPLRTRLESGDPLEPIDVPAQGDVTWEAEQGLVFPEMAVADDPRVSGQRYVWQPVHERMSHPGGSVFWPLRVSKAGAYYLWGRTLGPDANSNSFSLTLIGPSARTELGDWQVAEGKNWRWNRFSSARARRPTPLALEAGLYWLQLRTREIGTKIDQLLLTTDPQHENPDAMASGGQFGIANLRSEISDLKFRISDLKFQISNFRSEIWQPGATEMLYPSSGGSGKSSGCDCRKRSWISR